MTEATSPSHHHHNEHHTPSERGQRKGRRLIDVPHVLGPHEEPATYWELFSDLLMVAAGTSLAEILEEEATMEGWLQFALFYIIFVNGWLLYTHHYTARFDDSSLVHSLVLFLYYLGMASSIVNAEYDSYKGFAYSIVFQRVAFGILMAPIAKHISKARDTVGLIVGWEAVSTVLYLVSAFTSEHFFVYLWIAGALWEFLTEAAMTVVLRGEKLIKINIEHTKERLGALVLIMLGESVITSTITYKSYAAEGSQQQEYYQVLFLSFLLIFMYTLLYFNMQPAAKDHALRRSRLTGVLLLLFNKLLGLSLLTIGACIKLTVSTVAKEQKELSPFVANALRLAVGASMTLLFLMRICHYGGKIPRPNDPPHATRLFYMWWAVFGAACAIPFLSPTILSPTEALQWPSALLFVLCVVESWFTHILEDHLPSETTTRLHSDTTYQSIPNVE